MSAVNGDKSRFNRERKQKIAKRTRNRALMIKSTATQPKPANGLPVAKPGSVSA